MSEVQRFADKPMKISPKLAKLIQDELGENVFLCYQCIKCTSGCPVAEFLDWQPNQIMRALQLGEEEIALHSQTPWLCASCQTCATRCPQGLDITAIMEFLTREARRRAIEPGVPEVRTFNEAFLREVKLWGRAYELGLMAEMKLRLLRTHKITEDLDLGVKMIRKHKLPFLPHLTRAPRQGKPAATPPNAVAYYPGCSLHSTATEFDASTKAVCAALGMTLFEPHGWLCCGSSAAHRSDPEIALRLPMENLRLIEQSGLDEAVMPCAACFNRHKSALYEYRNDSEHREAVNQAIGYEYKDTVRVSSLGEAIFRRVGTTNVAERVRKPLAGLRVVCYYGCLLTRPPQVTEAAHPENPMEMDHLMAALGAEALDWSYKTTCCGAAHSLTRPDIVLRLSSDLIGQARLAGADAIVVACPLCHTNLDARQFQMKLAEPMPVMYFTQMMAVAFGLTDQSAALHKNLIDPRPLLQSKGLLG